MPRKPARGPRDRGFTLIEVLVAFVIAAMAMAVLARAAVDGLGNAHLSARYTEALARARSHLAGLPTLPVAGDTQGDDANGFHWHLRIVPGAHVTSRQNIALTLFDVSVSMSWEDGDKKRVLQLDTQRAAAVQPNQS
jgi:general secretion pathway protein I